MQMRKLAFISLKLVAEKAYYKNTQASLIAGKTFGLEVNAEKIKYKFVY
jgi:hypothetical protein